MSFCLKTKTHYIFHKTVKNHNTNIIFTSGYGDGLMEQKILTTRNLLQIYFLKAVLEDAK